MSTTTPHDGVVHATAATPRVRTISTEELRAKLERGDAFVFVMAMDQHRFEMAHIEGSISYDTFETELATIDRSVEVVLYCTNPACVASKVRAALAVEAGFTNVARFAGGLAGWAAAGLPVRSGVPQPA